MVILLGHGDISGLSCFFLKNIRHKHSYKKIQLLLKTKKIILLQKKLLFSATENNPSSCNWRSLKFSEKIIRCIFSRITWQSFFNTKCRFSPNEYFPLKKRFPHSNVVIMIKTLPTFDLQNSVETWKCRRYKYQYWVLLNFSWQSYYGKFNMLLKI